jgi:hypothetical protein
MRLTQLAAVRGTRKALVELTLPRLGFFGAPKPSQGSNPNHLALLH